MEYLYVHEGESVAVIHVRFRKIYSFTMYDRLIEPTEGVIELRGEQINTPLADEGGQK